MMSHNVTVNPGNSKKMREETKPIPFDPRNLFAQIQVTISTLQGQQSPQFLPQSFRLLPQIGGGNIQLTVDEVKYPPPPPSNPPIWKVENSVLSTAGQISITMRDGLKNLLLLTGARSNLGTARGSAVFIPSQGGQFIATWQAKQLLENSSFKSEFSWTFLLAENNEDPISVILVFEINVGKTGTLKQCSSVPSGWKATGFDEKNGLLFTLTDPKNKPYCLMRGLFSGSLGALVCQGFMSAGANCVQKLQEGDGNWTGTSGGPINRPADHHAHS